MERPQSSDRQLLERFASDGSQAAFTQLVERHIKLVYSTCYRRLRQRELAEEAAQAVFLTLAQKARQVRSEGELAGWLHATARFTAGHIARQERRRMMREVRAFHEAQQSYERSEEEAWSLVEPALDDALGGLSAQDQQAILLRFFDQMSLSEVGLAMGTNEDAARKRVSRALERLRDTLISRKAATISSVALAALLTKHAVYAVPAHLPASVAQSAGAFASPSLAPLASSAEALMSRGGSSLLARGLLVMSTTKIMAGAAAVIVLAGLTFFAVHRSHSATATGPAWQAPPAFAGTSSSQVEWNVPPASDPATLQAQQQVQAQIVEFGQGLASADVDKVMSVFSPAVTYPHGNTYTKHGATLKYDDVKQFMGEYLSDGPASVHIRVISCTVAGDTARVRFVLGPLARNKKGQGMGDIPGFTFAKTNGRWLIVSP